MTPGLLLILVCPFMVFYGSDPFNGDDVNHQQRHKHSLVWEDFLERWLHI